MSTATKPEIWIVLDKDSYPVFTAGWKEACHEHINDVVLHDKSAAKWVVRQVDVRPAKTESVLIENVAHTLPIEVACELLRLHMELADAKKDAERYRWLRTNDDWSTTPRSIVILYDGDFDVLQQGELDEAIDNAIQAEGKA